ncbi:NFIL3 [Cordylochernes scorpioides]|uniref:NFIL3 n=1 Tax=Cordylochernes scorpioides TaxID=51811 RepID=A0ABY6K590_9ARAC|nr:NFIL3 [Cordylochernes scorpioides]UYV63729.1 NFIL3 [Cordylochernes scorpioides]
MMVTESESPTAPKRPRLHSEGSTPSLYPGASYVPPTALTQALKAPPSLTAWSATPFSLPVDLSSSQLKKNDLFPSRKQREFIPDSKKDESYWDRRRRNNEAAKRSREKRRLNDMVLESRVIELTKENAFLRAELSALKEMCERPGNGSDLTAGPGMMMPIVSPVASPRLPLVSPLPGLLPSRIEDAMPHIRRHPTEPYAYDPMECCILGAAAGKEDGLYINVPTSSFQTTKIHGIESPNWSASAANTPATEDVASSASKLGSFLCLPHKLRHKSHLGENAANSGSTSPADSGFSGATQDPSSSDGGDSVEGQDSPSPQDPRKSSSPPATLKSENLQLRSDLKKLAAEVATLKDAFFHSPRSGKSDHKEDLHSQAENHVQD